MATDSLTNAKVAAEQWLQENNSEFHLLSVDEEEGQLVFGNRHAPSTFIINCPSTGESWSVCSKEESMLLQLQDVMEWLDSQRDLTIDAVLHRVTRHLSQVGGSAAQGTSSSSRQKEGEHGDDDDDVQDDEEEEEEEEEYMAYGFDFDNADCETINDVHDENDPDAAENDRDDPDAAENDPDAVENGPDAAENGPDAAENGPDAAAQPEDGNPEEDDTMETFFQGATGQAQSSTVKRLCSDMRSLAKAGSKYGFTACPKNGNLFKWTVKLLDIPKDCKLGKDLKSYAQLTRKEAAIQMEMQFPPDYPVSPPFLRVIRPRFRFLTGHVTIGGSICMQMLTKSGWQPTNDIESVLMHVRCEILSDPKAALDRLKWRVPYSEYEARNAFNRMVHRYGWDK
ncbi:uncharacterized protein LOC143276986 [Babylonia areolata]|uniref:uncharacterized protein LOC143276986 n=1 Tax=Babylonia areolata TaxID=304850 RepID=UPI003FD61466